MRVLQLLEIVWHFYVQVCGVSHRTLTDLMQIAHLCRRLRRVPAPLK